jgi:hypothetical protein
MYLRLGKSTDAAPELRKVAERIQRYAEYGDIFAFFRQNSETGPLYAQKPARKLRVT